MGVLNVTPDSFSDGGHYANRDTALRQGERLAGEGADILDVGGESTRPGSSGVSVQEEIDRVAPVIEALAGCLALPISVDTSKPEVMRAAVAAGAGLINDVQALRRPGALIAAAALAVPVCLMHMRGTPASMQEAPAYADPVAEVADFLSERVRVCEGAGIPRQRLILDPGFGFGKTLEHNLALLAGLGRLAELGLPLLVGLSRKSMIGALTGREVGDRLAGSLAAAVLAVERGAILIRVHDVAATRDVVKVAWALMRASGQNRGGGERDAQVFWH
ncbi:MAG: dihydropteroate synthase [Chromatiaceae bacterium]